LLVDTESQTRNLNNLLVTRTSPAKQLCHDRSPRSKLHLRSNRSIIKRLSRTEKYHTAVAMATTISFSSSVIDEGSECFQNGRAEELNEIEEYNGDYDGDSMTDYGGTDLDVEGQHQQQDKKLPPPSHEAPKTHLVEFDPLALGRDSSNQNSRASRDDPSASGKKSVTSFSDPSSENSKKKKTNQTSNSKVKNMVRSETRKIRRWKFAAIIFVALLGLVLTIYTFLMQFRQAYKLIQDTTPEEKDDPLYYKAVFDFEDAANNAFRKSVRVLDEISRALTEHANRNSTTTGNNSQTEQSLPFVTLPSFPDLARKLSEVGMVGDAGDEINETPSGQRLFQRVFWAPHIQPSSKVDWEKYSFVHQGWIMDTDFEEHREVDGFDDQTATDLWLEQQQVEEEYADPESMPVNIPPLIHTDLFQSGHKHSEQVASTLPEMTMTTRFQFSSDPDAKKTLSYLPVWQTFDFDYYESNMFDSTTAKEPQFSCDVSFVNFDLYSWFSPASEAVPDVRSTMMDDDDSSLSDSMLDGIVHVWNDKPFQDVHQHHDVDQGTKCTSSLFLRVPVYDQLQTKNIVGSVIAVLDEEIGFFRESVIKSGISLFLVVKEEKNGNKLITKKERTYNITGTEIQFMGNDDLHDTKYDDNVYKFKLRSQSDESTSSTSYSVYPTEDFFKYANLLEKTSNSNLMGLNLSQNPVVVALWSSSLVASVFAVILIIFVCYDNSVEDRQRKLLRQAERTDAIVGSMFPSNIQGRLMMIDDDTIESSQRQRGGQKEAKFPPVFKGFDNSAHMSPALVDVDNQAMVPINNRSIHKAKDLLSTAGKAQPLLLTRIGRKQAPGNRNRMQLPSTPPLPMNELNAAPSALDQSILRFINTKPMADFYPNTTILMCDIAGFTAWSSARAPADVFRLLETIYGAFDDIARAEKVFKVETVGDCYVACAGLPVKQPKHAVIMAKFAKKTLKRYETLIKKLETYLGPDTVDLGLRMGIHSGPVTAGVLRGDKTRFQLFGDTVNTASRMESTGKVNRIQCSPQTANLLKDEGLGKWVIPRQNLVTVKGKGEMQTYWLQRSVANSMSSNLSQPSLTSPLGSQKVSGSTLFNKMSAGQQRRNSMGASNASWETSSTGTQSSGSVQSRPKRRHSNNENSARNSKERRLIEWMVETFMKSLKKIAKHRARNIATSHHEEFLDGKEVSLAVLDPEAQIIEEIKEVIPVRRKESPSSRASTANVLEGASAYDGNAHVVIPRAVERQLRDFITVVSLLYHDHAFHNFEHCAHVLMSVMKLISRILESKLNASDSSLKDSGDDHAYGITTDPLLEFSCLFSALVHDVDHSGVPNSQLVTENTATAVRYKNRSVAEQHSVAVAWSLLMQPCYRELRECIYRTQTELDRFRQLVVNAVMATDIMDRDLKKFRDNRWEKAFDVKNDYEGMGQSTENSNRMATVVIEHMIQASDVAHTMQHWILYLKFNERLFKEMYQAYKDGRAEKDPSEYWYEGELGFFDFYIIPLASKLKECGVFGVSGDEYFFQAESNRSEWALKGKEIVEGYVGRASRDSSRNSSRSSSPNPMLSQQLLKLPEEKEPTFRDLLL